VSGLGKKHRILLVEDHTLLREGLRSLLETQADFDVVGEAGDGLEAIAQARRLEPDLVLMDLSMPKMTGLEALREITRQHPGTKAIALTMHNTEEHLRDALRAGAAGYVLKTASHTEMIGAVRSVLAGQRYLSPQVAKPVIEGYLGQSHVPGEVTAWDTLTAREREVLKLIAEGYKSREIADQLCISQSTVEKHRVNLMRKLDLHSVSAVTAYAAKRGLISA
jgi:DNA-binding NarL/FixJ family response regulator